MKHITLSIVFLFFLSMGHAKPERYTVKGIISDLETHTPIAGATVHIKGTQRATISDPEGRYHIHPNPGQTLVVSFVGYVSEEHEITPGLSELNFQLEPDMQIINEVMVTGALGIRRAAREVGGSAQVLNTDEINRGRTVNPVTGLTAKVSGLRINMYDSKVDPQVQITMRGTRSLSGNNEPLYVVDGVPVPSINRLNPNDIANITVLKGANAAALYGSEGVNGVLMITTHNGSKGKGTVSFSSTTTFSNVFKLPEAQTQFGQGVNGVYSPTEHQSWGPAFDGTLKDFGSLLPDGTQPQVIYAAPVADVRKDLFNTGVTMQNNLAIGGSDRNSDYYLSIQDVAVKGIIPDDKSRRTGIRFNGAKRFGKLSSSFNLNYTLTNNNTTPDGPWVTMYQMPANFPIGQMKDWHDPNSLGNPHYFFTDRQKNPYFQIENTRNKMTQQMVNSRVEFNYKLLPWMSATYRAGLYSTAQETRNTTGKFEAQGRRNVEGSVTDGSSNFRRLNSDLVFTMNKEINNWKNRLIIGNNVRDDYTKTISIGSNSLLLPDLFNQGSRTGELSGSATITQYRQLAVYGEFTSGYNNLLFFTLTGRNEWVSVLSKENRSYFYPGVNTSFVFTEGIERLKNNHVLNFGKIYASFNKTGNVNLAPYGLNNAYSQVNGFPFDNLVGFTPSARYPNPDIKPEFVTSWEIGMQLGFFANRMHVETAYVFSDSRGQIFNATTSRATGYSSAVVNAGRLTNSIIELAISGDAVRTRNFKWNLAYNFSYINNQVSELFEGLETFAIFRQSYASIGRQYPSLHVADYARDPQGRVVVDAVTGHPKPATELTHLGTMVPPYIMGLNSTFNYKNLTLSMLFDCRLGAWMYSEVANRMIQNGTHPVTAEYNRKPFVFPNSVIETASGIYTENTEVLTQGGGNAAFWNNHVAAYHINFAAPGDFLKLRELNLNFIIPSSLLSKQKVVKEASIGFVGTNLFLITHKDNNFGDPEYLYNNTAGYYSWRQVPPYRTFGFNINIVL